MIIRIRGVKRVRAKGRIYYYHRATMTRLSGEPGTTKFMDQLRELEERPEGGAPIPGTLGALFGSYRSSPEFLGLSERTRSDYQEIMDFLKPLDGMPIIQIDGNFLYKVRDKAFATKKRRFANYIIQLLRLIFNWGIRRGVCERNPAVMVEFVRRPRDAAVVNRPWKPEELEVVLTEAPPELRVAIAIGAFIGLREADMLRVSWACYDGAAFEVRQSKTGSSIWVPAHYRLREILDDTPRRSPVIVVGAKGRPFTQNGFQRRFFGLIRKLTDAKLIEPGLSFHGLRHMVGTRLAEAGCDHGTIAAILGHATTAMAVHYSKKADRRHLAEIAIGRLERLDRKVSRMENRTDKKGKPA
jgi:integrase